MYCSSSGTVTPRHDRGYQKGLERGDEEAKGGKRQSRNIRHFVQKCDLYSKIVESGIVISFLYFEKNSEVS